MPGEARGVQAISGQSLEKLFIASSSEGRGVQLISGHSSWHVSPDPFISEGRSEVWYGVINR